MKTKEKIEISILRIFNNKNVSTEKLQLKSIQKNNYTTSTIFV